MSKQPDPITLAAEVRRQAEAKLQERLQREAAFPASQADPQRLLHELQVHQIQLEMQNEDLAKARSESEVLLDLYTDLYDFSPVGYCTLAQNGAIQQINLTGATLLGVARGNLIQRRFGLFVATASRPAFNDFLARVFAGQGKEQCEITLQKEGDAPLWVHLEARLDEKQNCRAVMMDITARKQAEEALRASEKMLHKAQIMAGLGSYSLDIATGLWKSSDVLDDLFGIDDAYERSVDGWAALIHPNDRQRMTDYLATHILGQRGRFDQEYRIIRHADKAERWVHGLGELEIDTQNRVLRLYGTIQDITERKQAEEQMRFQATLLNAVGQAVIATDTSGIINYLSSAAESLYGWAADEAIGRNIIDVTVPQVSQEQAAEILSQLAQGKTWAGEFLVQRRDGSVFPAQVHDSPILDETGKLIGIIGVSSDITERKQAQEALQESELFAKATLDALSAHLAILDENGVILAVNRAWRAFAEANSSGSTDLVYAGVNYLSVCETSFGPQCEEATEMAAGIRAVMRGEQTEFSLEYPCHAPHEKRWFNARVTRFPGPGPLRVVVAHENITERKQAEDEIKKQLDELQRWHNATLGREMRALEIKREVNELLSKAGQPPLPQRRSIGDWEIGRLGD